MGVNDQFAKKQCFYCLHQNSCTVSDVIITVPLEVGGSSVRSKKDEKGEQTEKQRSYYPYQNGCVVLTVAITVSLSLSVSQSQSPRLSVSVSLEMGVNGQFAGKQRSHCLTKIIVLFRISLSPPF